MILFCLPNFNVDFGFGFSKKQILVRGSKCLF